MTTIRRLVLALATATFMAGASSAYADTLNYSLTGPGPGGTFNAIFTLSGNPKPSGGNPILFWFTPLPVDVNGKLQNITVAFNSLFGAGILGSSGISLGGSQLFSWSSSGLTMNTGTFHLWLWNGSSWGPYTLTVTRMTSVPESSTLVLLTVGLVLLFGLHALRRFRVAT